jgi:hypothetical protein
MDPVPRQVAQRLIDHPLTHHTRDADKGRALDPHGKMRFARAIVAHMPGVMRRVVDHLQYGRGQRIAQQLVDFAGDRARRNGVLAHGMLLLPFLLARRAPRGSA